MYKIVMIFSNVTFRRVYQPKFFFLKISFPFFSWSLLLLPVVLTLGENIKYLNAYYPTS